MLNCHSSVYSRGSGKCQHFEILTLFFNLLCMSYSNFRSSDRHRPGDVFRVSTASHSVHAQAPAALNRISGLESGWMDEYSNFNVASRLADYCYNCQAHTHSFCEKTTVSFIFSKQILLIFFEGGAFVVFMGEWQRQTGNR